MRFTINTIKALFAGIGAAAVVGCSGLPSIDIRRPPEPERVAPIYDQTSQAVRRHLTRPQPVVQPADTAEHWPTTPPGASTYSPWVSTQVIEAGTALPTDVASRDVVINEPHPIPVESMLVRMERVTGTPIRIELDVLTPRESREGAGGSSRMNPAALASMLNRDASGLTQISGPAAALGLQAPGSDVKLSLSYKGKAAGMLDSVATALKARWRYDAKQNQIVFYRYQTKTLRMAALAGTSYTASSVETSSAGAKSTAQFGGQANIWQALTKDLEAQLSPEGRYSVSEATGTVTVNDYPEAVDRIGEFIAKINDGLKTQVAVDVKVYRVFAEDIEQRGINLAGAFRAAGLNVETNGLEFDPTGLASMVLSVPDTATGWMRHIVGSEAMIRSLAQIGRTSTVTEATVNTVNNQPAPLRVGRKINYLRSSTRTTNSAESSTTLEPGEIDAGFHMQVLPHVQDDKNHLMLQVALTLSTLDDLKVFESDGSRIQLPEISSRDFLQRVWMQNGQTLVLAGLQYAEDALKQGGPVTAGMWGLGGNKDKRVSKEMLVITLTPIISGI